MYRVGLQAPLRSLTSSQQGVVQLSWTVRRVVAANHNLYRFKHSSAIDAATMGKSAEVSKPVTSSTSIANSFDFTLGGKANATAMERFKELLVFYKNGIKQTFSNKKMAKGLKKKQAAGQELTRKEYQLISRAFADSRKLVPFAFLLVLFPEAIPFILVFAPSVVPSTCITEKQMENKIKKVNEKRQAIVQSVLDSLESGSHSLTKEEFQSPGGIMQLSRRFESDFQLNAIQQIQLSAYCRFMGLADFGPRFMLERRLSKHLDYLREDDGYLAKQGLGQLSMEELRLANEERGMSSIDKDEKQLSKNLQTWVDLHLSSDPAVPKGLMVFSRIFQNLPKN
ncbi:LETM1-domain-containing protein [Basidiobolus meristosporus CBS 931.73]|uniref:LETM1-domain-containing protein n=1 Tax=Basidiobolus meristosporus CBS 931.73 TaxID=1314790 RepID=A0A1Y1Z8X8_9FUNG|nr:LETM1-domain-containing protein [Basidiobolus meristosporus CBS 931.73]|eukprot:ORY06554.1 LETM1-domain-containing protein [Basidiobolus meristosporus CBS 931.73]